MQAWWQEAHFLAFIDVAFRCLLHVENGVQYEVHGDAKPGQWYPPYSLQCVHILSQLACADTYIDRMKLAKKVLRNQLTTI